MKNLRLLPVPGRGPEDVLWGQDGTVYTGLKNTGTLIRVDNSGAEVVAEPGGRPLGLEWLPDGRILMCNAEQGLLAIDARTGAVEPLPLKGVTAHLTNNAHVLPDGTILFSDSSSRFALDDYPKDLMQNTASGRLIRRVPDGTAEVLLDGLSFANGVVVAGDEALIAATGTCTITAVHLNTGATRAFAETDGHPDNMSLGPDGRVWVALPSTKNAALGTVHKLPLVLRKLVSNLPEALRPGVQLCCRVACYDLNGQLHALHEGDSAVYHTVTGMRSNGAQVAMGSIEQEAIAVFDL